MYDTTINTEKYSRIVSEIERFIESKKGNPATIEGITEKIDLSNNIVTVKLQSIKKLDLSRGSLILIREDNPLCVEIRATVRDIYNSHLKIEIKRDPSQFENKKVVIDTNKTNIILERLKNVIETISKGKISLDNTRILDFIVGESKPHYNKEEVHLVCELNKNQKEAVMKSIEADDFHLVIGPPGTGKTYVIEELINQFSRTNQKILITAWTNRAVDNIIKRSLKKDSLKIVRIGPINEIDPEVGKYSIFVKMKEHKFWKDVEKYRKIIDKLFKLIPEVKNKISLAQVSIDQRMDKVKILDRELENLINEKQKYGHMLSNSINNVSSPDISPINREMSTLIQKSEVCISLSKNILQLNNLQEKIPEAEYIHQFKRQTKRMKFSILSKKVPSLFSQSGSQRLDKLEQEYKKNKRHLDEILELQKGCNDLKKKCKKEFNTIYPDGNGHPDKDALNFEFKIHKILKNQYLPILKDQETSNTKIKILRINQEVYRIYLESLERKIYLLDAKKKGLNTELYAKINQKKYIYRQHSNLLDSISLYKKNVDKLIKIMISEIINDADLIAATAISSCHYFLDDIEFDVMMMDEASQVASFMSLLPLLKCKKFILVGDNKQLQPIEEEDISKEMNLSIFNRLFEMYPKASTLLTVQHRMHKTIAQIASEIFYEGKLITSEEVAENILDLNPGKHQFLNPKIPAVFIDTSKIEYYEDEVGSGCSNTKEAKYVAYIVSLFIKKGIKVDAIGVVTPYVKQKLLIREFLKDMKIKDIEVDTVHKFQGREKDIIIMSFARSKKYSFPQYKLKFIEKETLVNVAITRAKKKLILVGNSNTLIQSKLLHKIVNKIGKRNTIVL